MPDKGLGDTTFTCGKSTGQMYMALQSAHVGRLIPGPDIIIGCAHGLSAVKGPLPSTDY